MRYIYMHNFRGFSDALVPLASANFLVGENSTGKSSFLSLVDLLGSPGFLFAPDFANAAGLGGFDDIVSVAASDRSYFTIGYVDLGATGMSGQPRTSSELLILTFVNEEGLPRLANCISFAESQLSYVSFEGKRLCFRSEGMPDRTRYPDDGRALLRECRRIRDKPLQELEVSPPQRSLPLPYVFSLLASKATNGEGWVTAKVEPMLFRGIGTWRSVAPIRTQPKRIYDGLRSTFTPEGDHVPYVIRRALDSPEKAGDFIELLRRFGDASGLFANVQAHTFGPDPNGPFEVRVTLEGKHLNIANVGYGVSQVLPIVVEMISQDRKHCFAIQQPEVHLHPRAQAALGDLLHFMAVNHGHQYLVETHSDYLIDRFRLRMKESPRAVDAQVLFFSRSTQGNQVFQLPIGRNGQYPSEQPDEFRRFFINEQLSLLEV